MVRKIPILATQLWRELPARWEDERGRCDDGCLTTVKVLTNVYAVTVTIAVTVTTPHRLIE